MATAETIDINETFDLAYRFVTETNENIFLTGKAGTGKTTFLKYLKNHCNKNIVVAAPTGVAAINAGGVTLHSLFQLPFQPFVPTLASRAALRSRLKYSRNRLETIEKMDLLVIDEISMVRCDIIDAVDEILRTVRRNRNELFGGVQVLFIGDLYQLPPVAVRHEWELLADNYASPFFFDAQCLQNELPVFIELSTVYRQSDLSFINLLNRIRNNAMDEDTFDQLNAQFQPYFKPGTEERFITLTSHNAQADSINQRELSTLLTPVYSFSAEIEGEFPENNYPADAQIKLKAGAQVMFLKNDFHGRYYNGKIGTVDSLSEDEIIVKADGELIEVSQETWDNTRYEMDRQEGKLKQEVLGTFTQYPLRLAWATTIHKSQGLTFDNVMIDAAKAFTGGQVYVALSRCTRLEGIVLLSKIPPHAITCNPQVVAIQSHFSENLLADRFQADRSAYVQKILADIFSFEHIRKECISLKEEINNHLDQLNEGANEWTNTLCEKIANDAEVGNKFLGQIASMLSEEKIIEQNQPLQKRITAAAIHFDKSIFEILQLVERPELESEHTDPAKKINGILVALHAQLSDVYDSLQCCMSDFVLQDFLKHKFDYKPRPKKISIYAAASIEADIPGNEDLLKRLKQWRNEVCNKYDLPVYYVANQESLLLVSSLLPLTEGDLKTIKGFGTAKVKRYGAEILEIVREYCDKYGLESKMSNTEEKPGKKKPGKKEPKKPSEDISLRLFQEGKTAEEVAKERGFAVSTIEGHLSRLIVKGLLKIDSFLPVEIQQQIKEAAMIHGWENLKTLKENLPEQISYGQIRLVKSSVNKDAD